MSGYLIRRWRHPGDPPMKAGYAPDEAAQPPKSGASPPNWGVAGVPPPAILKSPILIYYSTIAQTVKNETKACTY